MRPPAVECRAGLCGTHELPRDLHRVEAFRVATGVGVGAAQGAPVGEAQRRGIRVCGDAEHLVR